ncbi:PREDICTED: uncharacterized protein LOC108757188 [Trachymyrmex septentrionalis]|uniref:uncharacterized protein LOC108757188 n=1 Tax=Trachymyrmex septentrionalis TaxID=34720 RepID=UPI00084F1CAF|nr:PREDICTED: uncharacterized protein LOC108757188 [Trachymyrmex septentrionalis]
MDSSGVKFSGGKLVPRSDLRVGTTSGNSCRIKSKNGRDIKVGTWNVRSLYRPGAFQSMVGEVEKYGVEVVALQETRWAGEGSLNAGSYTLHYGGSEIHSLGIGFMINRKILSAVKDIKFINERLGLLVVQGRWYKIAIINVHAPTEDKDGEIKDGFYEELEHLVDQLPNDYMKIVVGDFNAKIGKEDIFRPTIGLESLHEESNDNGVRVINFATGKNLIVKSTYFKHKNIHKQTWISPDGGTRNQIDHVLADKRRHTNVLDVRSYRGADCDSDHLFVIAKIRERLSLNKTNGQLFGTKRLNVQGLIEGENGIKYAVEVTNRLAASKEIDESDDNTVDKHWENVRDAIVKSAEATVGFCKRNKNKPWFDEECVKIVKVRNEARITWLAQNTKETRDQFLKIRQEAHNMFKIKKRQYLKRKIEEIDENCKSSNVRGTYMGINNFRKGFQARTEMVKDENDNLVTDTTAVLNTWKNYFDRLLNVESENDREIENFEYHTAEPRINEPTISEVESAIKKLKNHKAPGNDLIPAELIKWGGSRLIEEIQKLIILIWNKEALPEQWKDYDNDGDGLWMDNLRLQLTPSSKKQGTKESNVTLNSNYTSHELSYERSHVSSVEDVYEPLYNAMNHCKQKRRSIMFSVYLSENGTMFGDIYIDVDTNDFVIVNGVKYKDTPGLHKTDNPIVGSKGYKYKSIVAHLMSGKIQVGTGMPRVRKLNNKLSKRIEKNLFIVIYRSSLWICEPCRKTPAQQIGSNSGIHIADPGPGSGDDSSNSQ